MIPVARIVFSALLSFTFVVSSWANDNRCSVPVATLVSLEGIAQWRSETDDTWQPAMLDMTFCYGDSLQVLSERAALKLSNDTLVRLNEKAHIRLIPEEASFLMELFAGAAHFISRTPKPMSVTAPYLNAAIDGTEFEVSHSPNNRSQVSLFEGALTLSNAAGEIQLEPEQTAFAYDQNTAPQRGVYVDVEHAIQWAIAFPRILSSDAHFEEPLPSLLNKGETQAALAVLSQLQAKNENHYTLQSALYLEQGKVPYALQAVDQALQLNPNSADAQALKLFIPFVLNSQPKESIAIAELAERFPNSASVGLLQSYWLQAGHRHTEALNVIQRLSQLNVDDPLLNLRLAELALLLDNHSLAQKAIQHISPQHYTYSRALTYQALIEVQMLNLPEALLLAQFAKTLSPNDAYSTFISGLLQIKNNELQRGRALLEQAVLLDPTNSVFRSYLGAAYSDERRPDKALTQFYLASEQDSLDPTPHLYKGIELGNQGRWIEAIHAFTQSQRLNHNRAIVRSALSLESDNAVRLANIGQAHIELNDTYSAKRFAVAATFEAPDDYAGHRMLAMSHGTDNERESLRATERLYATLLQPMGLASLPYAIGEAQMVINGFASPANIGLSDFSPLFLADRFSADAGLIKGSNETLAHNIQMGAYKGKAQLELGHYQYSTKGERDNNAAAYEVGNAEIRYAPTPNVSFMAEISRREESLEDVGIGTYTDDFSQVLERTGKIDQFRLGGHVNLGKSAKMLWTAAKMDQIKTQYDVVEFFGFEYAIDYEENLEYKLYDVALLMDVWALQLSLGHSFSSLSSTTDDATFGPNYLASDDENVESFVRIQSVISPLKLKWVAGLNYVNNIAQTTDFTASPIPSDTPIDSKLLPSLALSLNPTDNLNVELSYSENVSRKSELQANLIPSLLLNQVTKEDLHANTFSESLYLHMNYNTSDHWLLYAKGQWTDMARFEVGNNPAIPFEEVKSTKHQQTIGAHKTLNDNLHIQLSAAHSEQEILNNFSDFTRPKSTEETAIKLQATYLLGGLGKAYLEVNDIQQTHLFNAPGEETIKNEGTMTSLGLQLLHRRSGAEIELRANNVFNDQFEYADFSFLTQAPRIQNIYTQRFFSVNLRKSIH